MVFDLVAQGERGAGVTGSGGVELGAERGEGAGAAGRSERVEPHLQDGVARDDVAAGGEGFADEGEGFVGGAGVGPVQGAGQDGLGVAGGHPDGVGDQLGLGVQPDLPGVVLAERDFRRGGFDVRPGGLKPGAGGVRGGVQPGEHLVRDHGAGAGGGAAQLGQLLRAGRLGRPGSLSSVTAGCVPPVGYRPPGRMLLPAPLSFQPPTPYRDHAGSGTRGRWDSCAFSRGLEQTEQLTMRVDSRTVTVAAAGVLLTAALGALAGKSVGVAAGILAALVSLVGSAVVTVALERQSRQAADAARKQELLDMFAPPGPLAEREEEEEEEE